ncbi:APC family permease [Nocardia panacis]|uniref:APC family permease n=1 Tax=Nocardia panacis TaxID=2340916 RepID=A0A3A4KEJ7_9NOCA|nr:APC family permease [Nocardia panacis]RJO70879.1 APC family permease [Nocardia panacis]
MSSTTTRNDAGPVGGKGLASGRIGTISGAILGISTVAPGYTLTTSIGLIVAAVGLKMPAILIAGFIPMFLTAYAYRELNARMPDCGASFTWSAKAFGPYVGWMAGWGMVMASAIVLSNLSAIGMKFGYLFLARISGYSELADVADNKVVNILTTLALLAAATYVAGRGITTSERLQYVMVAFQLIVLLVFAVVALVKVTSGDAPAHLSFQFDWLNPFTGITVSAFVIGVTGSIFAFWGWDTCLTLGEESKDPDRVPGRAGLLCVVSILITYLLVTIAVMMYAGVREDGVGLGNPHNADNVFAVLADPVLGPAGPLLLLAIFASAVASLQTTFLPVARTLLAMGVYGAFPKRFAVVRSRTQAPVFGTIVVGVVTGVFYTAAALLSQRVLVDTVAALGIMICWYYGITAFACVWYFRRELFTGARNFVFKFLFPLSGGLMLAAVFVTSVRESMNPAKGSGASIGGIGLVFYMSFGILLLGAVLMLVMRWRQPQYFRATQAALAPDPRTAL